MTKPTCSRILLVGVLLVSPGASALWGGQAYHVRHGVKVPVEGKVSPVEVGDVDWPENFRPVDDDGWSVFRATPDVRILYVAADGDDATAVVYEPGDPAVGKDPFRPGGRIKPFGDINTALARQRPGMPDWVLMKRGDSWRGPITRQAVPPGKSAAEPRLIGAYGPVSSPRPRIVGKGAGFRLGSPHHGTQHVAIVSLELYNSWKDPNHRDWAVDLDRLHGPKGREYLKSLRAGHRSGIAWGNASHRGKPIENVLVEDCFLRFCPLSGTNFGGADMKNFVVRRNVVVDHYPLRGHTMGFWNSRGSLRLEENIVDHCGWYNQRGREPKIGWAIPLSHNLYYSKCWNTALVRNLWLRSASIGNKFRGDVLRSIGNLLVEDNLYVDGELGPGISGNYPGPYRNVNVNLVNNVLTDIGRSRPTNRHLAWYFPLADWDGGNIANNLLIRQRHPEIGNAYGIQLRAAKRLRDRKTGKPVDKGRGSLRGRTRNVRIFRNVVHGIRMRGGQAALKLEDNGEGGFENVRVYDNQFQCQVHPGTLAAVESLDGIAFRGNTWFSVAEGKPFRLGRGRRPRELSFKEWVEATGEAGARFEKVSYPDAGRSIESYMRTLGYKGDDEALYARFFAEARTMRRGAWRAAFTAGAINRYFREGFAMKHLPPEKLPPVLCGPFEPRFSCSK